MINAGKRALTRKVRVWCKRYPILGKKCIKKTFEDSEIGWACYNQEMLADKLFGGKPWKPPIIKKGLLWFIMPFYPKKNRLDLIAPMLTEPIRIEIARQAISILFDIFFSGYAHRDFHARNLFWIDQQVKVIDFEFMEPYSEEERHPFPLSYDITGNGLDSPGFTKNMCYTANENKKFSLHSVLNVSIERALKEFQKDLKNDLRQACRNFTTGSKKHTCRAEKIYASFELPYFSVDSNETQRDSEKRLQFFGIDHKNLYNKTVLDLGSNIGGILFSIQKYLPGYCLGIEYDAEKVLIAKKIAIYNGLNNVEFTQGDIDALDGNSLKGPFDVVFCLAIEAHVKKPKRLFKLLSQVTGSVLYFEGNSTTEPEMIKTILKQEGFHEVRILGNSKDDIIPENNCRPLIVAIK